MKKTLATILVGGAMVVGGVWAVGGPNDVTPAQVFSIIDQKEQEYFASHGTYFQVLDTHATPPAGVEIGDFTKVPMNRKDGQSVSLDKLTTLSTALPFSIRVDTTETYFEIMLSRNNGGAIEENHYKDGVATGWFVVKPALTATST